MDILIAGERAFSMPSGAPSERMGWLLPTPNKWRWGRASSVGRHHGPGSSWWVECKFGGQLGGSESQRWSFYAVQGPGRSGRRACCSRTAVDGLGSLLNDVVAPVIENLAANCTAMTTAWGRSLSVAQPVIDFFTQSGIKRGRTQHRPRWAGHMDHHQGHDRRHCASDPDNRSHGVWLCFQTFLHAHGDDIRGFLGST